MSKGSVYLVWCTLPSFLGRREQDDETKNNENERWTRIQRRQNKPPRPVDLASKLETNEQDSEKGKEAPTG